MQKTTSLILALAFTLTACSTNPPATKLLPTKINFPTIQITLTATVSAQLTLTLSPTQTTSATLDASQINSATQIALCNAGHWFESQTSPDGQWVATDCDDGNIFRLHIVRVDATKEWHVSFKDITGYESYGAFPSIPLPYHWYKDSRYLFIAPQVIVDGNLSDGLGLYRFDTQTGRYTPFLPVGESSYNFSFSPDDQCYVYSYGMDEKYIHIASLETGQEQSIQVPNGQGEYRHFLWSPDSTKIIFIYDNSTTNQNTLLLFDTKQKIFTTLLEMKEQNHIPIRWESESQVVLEENIWQGHQYLLDINTKKLQQIPTQQTP